jgi:hypothetical protein
MVGIPDRTPDWYREPALWEGLQEWFKRWAIREAFAHSPRSGSTAEVHYPSPTSFK